MPGLQVEVPAEDAWDSCVSRAHVAPNATQLQSHNLQCPGVHACGYAAQSAAVPGSQDGRTYTRQQQCFRSTIEYVAETHGKSRLQRVDLATRRVSTPHTCTCECDCFTSACAQPLGRRTAAACCGGSSAAGVHAINKPWLPVLGRLAHIE